MNAQELAERLRQRRKELEAASDWVPLNNKRMSAATSIPTIRMTYTTIYLNKPAREHIGWEPMTRMMVEYSPSQKVLKISRATGEHGYMFKTGPVSARRIYNSFKMDVSSIREMPGYEYRQEAVPVGDSLIIDVSPFVVEP